MVAHLVANATALVWPQVSENESMYMAAVPLGFLAFTIVWLNFIWTENLDMLSKEDGCCLPGERSKHAGEPMEEGRQYKADWKTTFDLVFLNVMCAVLIGLIGVTFLYEPELFKSTQFWLNNLFKLGIMCTVSILGGLLCRQLCEADYEGYIKTGKKSWFKVNYTRKFQHFAAYAIPLLVKSNVPGNSTLHLLWGDFFTLVGFLVLIKPLRENFKPFMLMFNSLDRPEDRPHCIKWIIAGNVWPGLIMIVFFHWLFGAYFGPDQQQLVMIFVLVAGVGDGLAEPVGIYFGRHKYRTRSCGTDTIYMRSIEGSSCVFLSTFAWIVYYYQSFLNGTQFWLCMAILPIASTIAEAVSPHTMDTPFLMGLGGGTIFVLLKYF